MILAGRTNDFDNATLSNFVLHGVERRVGDLLRFEELGAKVVNGLLVRRQVGRTLTLGNGANGGVLVSFTNHSQFFLATPGTTTNFPVVNATLSNNGVMNANVGIASGSFPLVQGTATVSPPAATSSVGPLNGNTFLAPDNSFYYAALTTPGAPGQVGFLFGGQPTVNLPATGVGSYAGSVVGSVLSNGQSRVATGTFTNNYNFSTNSGNFAVSNFDTNRSFSGLVTGVSGTTAYSGQVSGSNLSGSVNGAFYGNGASSTGGMFSVASQNPGVQYSATGVFGGHH